MVYPSHNIKRILFYQVIEEDKNEYKKVTSKTTEISMRHSNQTLQHATCKAKLKFFINSICYEGMDNNCHNLTT